LRWREALLGGEGALVHQELHEALVACELQEPSGANDVGSRVADLGDVGVGPPEQNRGEGRPHAVPAVFLGGLHDVGVRLAHRDRHLARDGFRIGSGDQSLAKGLEHERARDLACRVAPHAVGEREEQAAGAHLEQGGTRLGLEAPIGVEVGHAEGVLVDLSHAAHVGPCGNVDLESRHRRFPPSSSA
jgi:hypothetical protein